jgi:hypothetical protein
MDRCPRSLAPTPGEVVDGHQRPDPSPSVECPGHARSLSQEPFHEPSRSLRRGSGAHRRSQRRPRWGRSRHCPARSCGRGGARPTCPWLCLAARLLELEWCPVSLGARCIRRRPLRKRGVGPRSLGQAWPRLGVGRRPLATLALNWTSLISAGPHARRAGQRRWRGMGSIHGWRWRRCWR